MPFKKGEYSHSAESKKKISEASKGHTNAKGAKRTEEAKRKLSEARTGKRNLRWKGGRKKAGGGYISILKPDHPLAHKAGYVLEHRLIMEKYLGRYLMQEEVVHHINKKVADNRIENLILFPNNTDHTTYHRQLEKIAQNKGA